MKIVVNLPENWISVEFEKIILLAQNGCGARRGKEGKPTVVLRLLDLSLDGTISTNEQRLVPLSQLQIEKYALARGDLLAFRVNGSRDIAGQVAYYGGPEKYVFCDHFIRFKLNEKTANPQYVALAFKSSGARSQVENRMVSSAGQNTVAQSTYAAVNLPLPPLNEQRRIVAKIEALTARSRKAREALDAIPALLDQFRQSVLAAAFRGDLTADWRKQNSDVEPAEKLLERIRVERRVRWESAELEKMKAKGKVPKNDKWKEKYPEPEKVDLENLGILPEGWSWTNIDALSFVVRGASPRPAGDPKYFGGNIPWITVAEITKDEKIQGKRKKREPKVCYPAAALASTFII